MTNIRLSVIVLVFYWPLTFFMSFRARSVNLSTLFLGKPPRQFTSTFASNWQLPFLNQGKEENGRRDYFIQSPRKNVAGREDPTCHRPHTKRTRIRPIYHALLTNMRRQNRMYYTKHSAKGCNLGQELCLFAYPSWLILAKSIQLYDLSVVFPFAVSKLFAITNVVLFCQYGLWYFVSKIFTKVVKCFLFGDLWTVCFITIFAYKIRQARICRHFWSLNLLIEMQQNR